MPNDQRHDAPAARRNREPLLAALRQVLPAAGTVLEIGSGTGQHAAWFAAALAPLRWLPTDVRPGALASIAAWAADVPEHAPLPPRHLDAALPPEAWPLSPADGIVAMLAANVIHIAPWTVGAGLLAGAGHWLAEGGVLCLYGPFRRGGVHTAPSNAAFDARLRAEDPSWGVRDLDEVAAAAAGHGLALDQVIEMPANNLTVVFRRQGG
jgi:SAM-dependent methyltransferase